MLTSTSTSISTSTSSLSSSYSPSPPPSTVFPFYDHDHHLPPPAFLLLLSLSSSSFFSSSFYFSFSNLNNIFCSIVVQMREPYAKQLRLLYDKSVIISINNCKFQSEIDLATDLPCRGELCMVSRELSNDMKDHCKTKGLTLTLGKFFFAELFSCKEQKYNLILIIAVANTHSKQKTACGMPHCKKFRVLMLLFQEAPTSYSYSLLHT